MNSVYKLYKPIRMLVLFNLLSFGLLYFYYNQQNKDVLLLGMVMIGILFLVYKFIQWRNFGDEYLFLIASFLVSMGILMIYRLDAALGKQQILWFFIGSGLFLSSFVIYRAVSFWDRIPFVYPLISYGLFIATQLFGISSGGAKNWLSIGPYVVQPMEGIKLLFIFFIAAFLKNRDRISGISIPLKGKRLYFDNMYLLMALSFLHMVFLILQREWGGTLLFFFIYLSLLYVFDAPFRFLLGNVLLAVLGGLGGYLALSHIQQRVAIWLNPWMDVSGSGFQVVQSLFALGAGGFFGKGIGLGNPQYIPEVTTDFIFSAIAEEMGIFGGVSVVLLYFLLVYRGVKIALKSDDSFQKGVALGITALFGYQTFIIIGGVIKLIPLTGITLPFISYGGSSLITSFIALGILQGVSSSKDKFVYKELTDDEGK
ncbi:MAG TPA: cell cycle protein [Eubacteriaceae bacterium]|nr:cell cycle protein [Eubacteriaceae bacterium]